MRLSKILALAAVATTVMSASVAVSPASAETSTQLCNVHEGLVCPEGQGTTLDHLELAPGTVAKILSSLATILCLSRLELNTPLALANPQVLHTLVLITAGCGTNSTHTNCTLTTEEVPLWDLLKTGLDTGVEKALGGLLHLVCTEIGIFKVKVDCVYEMTGIAVQVGNQHVTSEKTPVKTVEGSFFCPENSTLDYLLETLEPTYVLE